MVFLLAKLAQLVGWVAIQASIEQLIAGAADCLQQAYWYAPFPLPKPLLTPIMA